MQQFSFSKVPFKQLLVIIIFQLSIICFIIYSIVYPCHVEPIKLNVI